MPFTLFHFGPGIAIKGLLGDNFSLLTFGISQIAIDIEPLIGMLRGADRLHTFSHTYLGALIIALVVILLAPIICPPLLRRWNKELHTHQLNWLISSESLRPISVITGAMLGTFSHIALDSLMHIDMTPLAPWSEINPLLNLISHSQLEMWCIGAGIGGVVLWFTVSWLRSQLHSKESI